MWSGNSDASWERFGAIDPYFGVYNQQRFHLDHLNEESLTEFFASGESHVNWILDVVRQHFDSSFHPTRALDFGCGVGRHAIPLARIASQVVAVDGSHSMLQEAKKTATNVRSPMLNWFHPTTVYPILSVLLTSCILLSCFNIFHRKEEKRLREP